MFFEPEALPEAVRYAAVAGVVREPGTPERPPAAPPLPAERVTVAFAGDAAGAGELTWGQRMVWLSMLRWGWLNIGAPMPQPPGRTVADLADELRYMMSRFPSLRTRLRFDAEGRPSQELFADGEIAFEVYDADGDADPQKTARAVYEAYLATARDFVREWPLRVAAVRREGAVTHMVIVVCHLATDGVGVAVLFEETTARVAEPPRGMEQLELVRWQDSPAGRRQAAAGLRHIEAELRSVPPRPMPRSADRGERRHWAATLTTAALLPAMQAIARRTRADSSTILLTLYAIALGRRELLNPAVLRPLVNNRFRPGLRRVVSHVMQSGVCVLDVAGATVDEAMIRARGPVRLAYKHAYYDPEDELALIDRLAREQPGAGRWAGDTWAYVNDRRGETTRIAAMTPPDASAADTIPELLARTEFRLTEWRDKPIEPLYLSIDDPAEGIVFTLRGDSWYVTPADGEALLRDMESLAIAAMSDSAVPTAVPVHNGP
ncbi:condensation domain-containing protein [Micromonospora wenchangensis]